VIGVVGALLGGWVATKLFHILCLHGFLNLSTWITAIVGAAVLLLVYHLITGRSSRRSGRSRRFARRQAAALVADAGPVAGGPAGRRADAGFGWAWWRLGVLTHRP
jgi:hypothetical protein